MPDYFIVECKNYNKKIEVGLVGKFFSLLSSTDIKLGIFFSNKPITGFGEKYWKHATAFVYKVNLRKDKILIDINFAYLENQILNYEKDNTGIITLLSNRKNQIDSDISSNFYNNISQHENEGKIKTIS